MTHVTEGVLVWSSWSTQALQSRGLQRYVREDLRRLDCYPARLLSGGIGNTGTALNDALKDWLDMARHHIDIISIHIRSRV